MLQFHGRNLCLIYLKIAHGLELGHPLFAIENPQNQSVTSGFIKNRAYVCARFSPKMSENGCQNQNCSTEASKVSFSTNSDLLNTNLII